MTPTQWMGAAILTAALIFWAVEGLRAAGQVIRDARTYAQPDDLMAVADAVDDFGTWDRELTTGGER